MRRRRQRGTDRRGHAGRLVPSRRRGSPENLLSGFTLSSSDTEKYQVDSATNSITVNDAAEHTVYFSGVTLDKDTTYTYEFTFRAASVSNSPQFRFPIRAEGFQKRPVAVPVAGDESGAPEHRLLEQQ